MKEYDCSKEVTCEICDGEGRKLTGHAWNGDPIYVICTTCGGSGQVACPRCGGTGKVWA